MTGGPQASESHQRNILAEGASLSPAKIRCPRGDLNSRRADSTQGHPSASDLGRSSSSRLADLTLSASGYTRNPARQHHPKHHDALPAIG